MLSDVPFRLWQRGELADELGLPPDGTRVEIIGGEIVVSPGPRVGDSAIVQDVSDAFAVRRAADGAFPWRCLQNTDLELIEIQDGYIPDLICIEAKALAGPRSADARKLQPDHIGLALEVTSKWNASQDRRPSRLREAATKWTGYARVGIPYYLLVDRAPKAAQTVLFSRPDRKTGEYGHLQAWEFGDTIQLPEPFSVEMGTTDWERWLD